MKNRYDMSDTALDKVFALSRLNGKINILDTRLQNKITVLSVVEGKSNTGCAISKARLPSVKRDIEKLKDALNAQKLLRDML